MGWKHSLRFLWESNSVFRGTLSQGFILDTAWGGMEETSLPLQDSSQAASPQVCTHMEGCWCVVCKHFRWVPLGQMSAFMEGWPMWESNQIPAAVKLRYYSWENNTAETSNWKRVWEINCVGHSRSSIVPPENERSGSWWIWRFWLSGLLLLQWAALWWIRILPESTTNSLPLLAKLTSYQVILSYPSWMWVRGIIPDRQLLKLLRCLDHV